MQSVACSVIVASHRPLLAATLCTHLKQQHTGRPFEVIVVTDYPNGALQRRFPEFIWLYIADRSISKKRNAGVRIAQGTVVAFTDDDCTPADDWIEQGCTYLDSHTGTAAVEGLTTIIPDPSLPAASTREYRRLEKPGYRTNNIFYRTTVFRTLGGFDERFTIQREDLDLAFSALARGYRIDYLRDLRVHHVFRSWERWDLLKNCWNRRFDPLLIRKHPQRYRAMIGMAMPPTIVAVLLLHITLLISLRSGRKRLSSFAACGELLLPALLGIRRTGLRPFVPERLILETMQIIVAPFAVLFALVYGFIFIR